MDSDIGTPCSIRFGQNAKTCLDGPDKMPTKKLGRTKCQPQKKVRTICQPLVGIMSGWHFVRLAFCPTTVIVSEKVFQTSKKARKRPMAALEPRGKSERKKKTPLRLLDWNVHILFELINTCFSAYLRETCWKSFPQILTNCYCVTINIARLANAVQVTLWLSVTNPQNQFHHLSRIVNSVTKSLNH